MSDHGRVKEPSSWLMQDLDAISKPALESVANSRWMAKTVKHLRAKGEHKHALNLTSGAHEILQNNILPGLIKLRTLDSLEPQDFSAAFDKLVNLKGFADWRPQFTSLQKRIESLRERDVDFRKYRCLFHAAILSPDSKLAEEFATHYHGVLTACGVFSTDEKAVRADGSNDRALDQAHGCGMCLIQNAGKLSSAATMELGSRMRSSDVVFVSNYTTSKEVSPDFLEERFFLRFDFLEALSKKAGGALLDALKLWSEENRKELEGGLDGIYARTFTSRIAENKSNDKGSKEERMKLALADVLIRQEVRIELSHANGVSANESWVSRSDLFGQEPDINSFHTPAWDALEGLIGLDQVKASLKSFLNGVLLDFHREMHSMKPLRSGLSRLFLGPPGTGKTTVGKLYGQILSHFGLLSSGGLVFKNATDFIGPHLGQSEERTKTIIRKAKGKVLMIDEAYMLDPHRNLSGSGADPYRQGVIDTLVGEVQNSPGEDLCVILCGYQEEMELMLQRANPGLARRFPVEDAFIFEEFDLPQLEKVLELKMEKEVGCTMTPAAKQLAMQKLNFARQRPKFGNGGEVDNLLSRAMANFRNRFGNIPPEEQSGDVCFELEDLDPAFKDIFQAEDQIEILFDGLADVEDLKESFRGLARRSTSLRRNDRDPTRFMPFYFVFKGADSTGKKTVAKKLSSLYHVMRLLPTNHVRHTSAQELLSDGFPKRLSETVPRKSSNVQEMMENSLGKVLYIEQAHRLSGSGNDQVGTLVRDVRTELIETLKKPRFFGRMVVILAGYETPMDRLLTEQPAFAQIFRMQMQFHPLTNDACYDILERQMRAEDVDLAVAAQEQLEIKEAFQALSESKQWASVNDIQEITNQLIGDALGKELIEDSRPSITGFEILQVLRAQYPQLSRGAENLRRLHEGRQKLGQVISERKAQEAGLTETNNADAILAGQNFLDAFEYPELLKGRYIRVLHLLPANNHEDPIQCDLEKIHLDTNLDKQYDFTAVSYVCGSQNRTQMISCNGRKFLTTRNSEIVLRNLRQKDRPCKLWIDSICINQQSIPERNEQVSFMGHIFEIAEQVYIWLGQASPETYGALRRFQKLADRQDQSKEDEMIPTEPNDSIALREVMKNQWWQRLWTFQEFVVARKLVIVMGHLHILWQDFYGVVSQLSWPDETGHHAKGQLLTLDQYLPKDHELLWVEVGEAVMARTAYKESFPQARPLSMSHFLIQTRNRKAENSRDKLYGLYYLFETFGYQLPKIDYEKSVAEIYRGISLCLVRRSRSWWILTHLFNRRDLSTLELPSWVPDFSTRTLWHQHYGVRVRNANELVEKIDETEETIAEDNDAKVSEAKEGETEEREAESREKHGSTPEDSVNTFLLEEHVGSIKTNAIFLWTVTCATSEMPANAALDLSLEQSFDSVASDVLDYAQEDFLFILASWLKLFDSSDTSRPLRGEGDMAVELPEQFASHNESQMMKAVACAFYRSFVSTFRAAEKRIREKAESGPEKDREATKAKVEEARHLQISAGEILPNLINNIRRCISPDERHPCRYCMTKVFHKRGNAVDHFFEWSKENGIDPGGFIVMLYSRAIDHSLFQTNATGSCGGHFGFCRNLPRAGDDVVMLPGLPDPVILRQRAGTRPGEVDTYSVVGVTTGMLGPSMLDLAGNEVKGDYCFSKCPEMANLKGREPRAFYLV